MKKATRKFLTLVFTLGLFPVMAMAQAKEIKFDPSTYKSQPNVYEMGIIIPDTTKFSREELQEIEAIAKSTNQNGPKKTAKKVAGIYYYRNFTYSTSGVGGSTDPILLSAKLIWKQTENDHLILYCPWTHCKNSECATEDTGSYEDKMFNGGNIILTTDGEGFGNTRNRTQVYLNHELWAKQEVATLEAGLSIINGLKPGDDNYVKLNDGWDTIIVGMSQGAGTALATLRYMEEGGLTDMYRINFANICCGPYDPALTLKTYFQSWFRLTYPCVIPMVIKSYMLSYPDILAGYKEEDFYADSYLAIKSKVDAALADKEHNADAVNDIFFENLACSQYLESKLLDKNPAVYVTEILRPDIIEGTSDLAKKFLECCERNNVLRGDWVPKHFVKIMYCPDDAVVPYENTQELIQRLQDDNYSSESHGTGHATTCTSFLTSTWASKTF